MEGSINESSIKAAFVVSKKAGNAVWRNRVKRLFREAYRNNKISLSEVCSSNNLSLFMIFSPKNLNKKKNKEINLSFILNDFIDLLEKVERKVQDA